MYLLSSWTARSNSQRYLRHQGHLHSRQFQYPGKIKTAEKDLHVALLVTYYHAIMLLTILLFWRTWPCGQNTRTLGQWLWVWFHVGGVRLSTAVTWPHLNLLVLLQCIYFKTGSFNLRPTDQHGPPATL